MRLRRILLVNFMSLCKGWVQKQRVTVFYTVARNTRICGSAAQNVLRVTLLTPRIVKVNTRFFLFGYLWLKAQLNAL
jgi:hypothetical protein